MLVRGDSLAVKSKLAGAWLTAVESFDLRYNLRFKIIGVGGVKSIGSSDLSESKSKLRNIPIIIIRLMMKVKPSKLYFLKNYFLFE